MLKVLITGATGFVGSSLADYFQSCGDQVRYTTRNKKLPYGDFIEIGDLSSDDFWREAVGDSNIIIHCMARVHVMNDVASNPYEEFKKINFDATMALARAAKEHNVAKFVFISTVGVYGNKGLSISEDDPINPNGDYAQTKYEAETALIELFRDTSTDLIILRPPLIYGKNAPGNFKSLEKVISKHIPLPLGLINNKRSFLYVENLVWAIDKMVRSTNRFNGVYNISDNEVVSTSDFLKGIAKNFKLSFILPFPIFLLKILGQVTGKSKAINKLTDDLSFDASRLYGAIGQEPPYKMTEALSRTFGR
ncbi:NAD-dependent epimerase/dehydratase family protein [Halobacteriovorax sp. HLS]|uniref:NAD-dependent epimerase/dehydratase family protein n=1 Tax=Halobacteriovorax sp. HLS TaxID=2234000 RepID=UPI0013E3CC88|nr:NAD-dependent epimerase/dehydratase family protein [Halobacteriovorax sp. HLS]